MFHKTNGTEAQIPADDRLLEKIQPRGGIKFGHSRYVQTGTGYETCIHVYQYPNELDTHWMADITNLNNTIVTIDVSTDNLDEVKKNLNRSIEEQESRYNFARNFSEAQDAETRYQAMTELYREISRMGEVIKLVHARIFVADYTISGLENKVKETLSKLDGNEYVASIFLNEAEDEWKSMWQSYLKQKENVFAINGQPLTSMALAAGNPYHFSSLEDPYGQYLGYTPCGGNVIFDPFFKTKKRRHYNALAIGTMGSGKSTLLKKLYVKQRAILGDFVRVFDVSGEFEQLIKKLGGKVIKADGEHGIINHLEILQASDSESINYMRHFSKLNTIYRYLVPEADRQELMTFQSLLKDFYHSLGFTLDKQITGLPADQYPIYSDLLTYINAKISDVLLTPSSSDLEASLMKQRIHNLENIRNTIAYLIDAYGAIFNGHTSIDNITDEQVVSFDISHLKDMEPSIFDAQIFNMVSLCWDNAVTNGRLMEQMRRKGEINIWDITHTVIVIDESHRWINAQKPQALDMITTYAREARKYYGAIVLASQSVRDYVPEGSSDLAVNKLKTLFELMQYKFIFHQDSNTLSYFDKVFGNELTASQKERIPRLEEGETFLSIASDMSIKFTVYLTDTEEQLFNGGM